MENPEATHRVSYFADDGRNGASDFSNEAEAVSFYEERARDPGAGLIVLLNREFAPGQAPGEWRQVKISDRENA